MGIRAHNAVAVVLLIILGSLTGLACGGSDGADEGGGASAGSPATSGGMLDNPPQPEGEANPDATLNVAVGTDVGAVLDPRLAANTPGRSLMLEFYDGLVVRNYYDPSKPFEIEPALAESWEVSDDGKVYTFKLRENVTFTDGTPFNAEAVVFNFRTILDKDFEHYYETGAASTARATQNIDRVEADGEYTVNMHMKEPFAAQLDLMADPAQLFMISPTAIRENGNEAIAKQPVGTGPFKLESYRPKQALTLVRNDDHWRGPAGVAKLVMQPMTDEVARVAALQSGDVQVAEDVSTRYREAWGEGEDTRVVIAPRQRTYSCFFNYRGDRLTTNKEFRTALSLGTDRAAINTAVLSGLSTPANGFYVGGTPADEPGEPLATDVEAAKKIIDDNGWAGTEIKLEVAPGLGDPTAWELFQQNMRDIGVNVDIATVDLLTWVEDFSTGLPADSPLDGLCAAGGNDSLWTLALYGSEAGFPEIGGRNPGYYSAPAVEAALDEARQAPTQEAYTEAMQNASTVLTEDIGLLFMVDDLNVMGVGSTVRWQPTASQQHTFYSAEVIGTP